MRNGSWGFWVGSKGVLPALSVAGLFFACSGGNHGGGGPDGAADSAADAPHEGAALDATLDAPARDAPSHDDAEAGTDGSSGEGGVACGPEACDSTTEQCCRCPGLAPQCIDRRATCDCPPPPDGGARCGDTTCGPDEQCCPGCPGDPPLGCYPASAPCPILDCPPPPLVCDAMDARAEGPCRTALGYAWDGCRCRLLTGCRCVGADCESLYPPTREGEGACRREHVDCPSDACPPDRCESMDARGEGLCERLLGHAWNGRDCVPLSGCRCVGSDCDSLYPSVVDCLRAYVDRGCLTEDCRLTGCPDGQACLYCWAGYTCLPEGAMC